MPVKPDKYRGVIIQGAHFPDDPIRTVPVKLNATIRTQYLPELNVMDLPAGLKLLMTVMTHIEGFRQGTRSYRTNNPGNIGNTDSGANTHIDTLAGGIALQARFIQDIAAGRKKAYPLGKEVFIKPYFSPEIAANQATYGIPPWLPGYRFIYTGELEQFAKIYSTAARVSNTYVNTVISYFAANEVWITPTSTLAEIIAPEPLTGAALVGKIGGGTD